MSNKKQDTCRSMYYSYENELKDVYSLHYYSVGKQVINYKKKCERRGASSL